MMIWRPGRHPRALLVRWRTFCGTRALEFRHQRHKAIKLFSVSRVPHPNMTLPTCPLYLTGATAHCKSRLTASPRHCRPPFTPSTHYRLASVAKQMRSEVEQERRIWLGWVQVLPARSPPRTLGTHKIGWTARAAQGPHSEDFPSQRWTLGARTQTQAGHRAILLGCPRLTISMSTVIITPAHPKIC